LKVTNSLEEGVAYAIQMTDAVQLKYDPESANKLPNKYKLPPLPALIEGQKITDYGEQLNESRKKLDEEVAALRKLASGLSCDHPELLTHTLAFIEESTNFLNCIFRVSISSTSLQKQSDLTSVATALANAVDAINKSSRSLFLSIPTWNTEANTALDHFIEQENLAVKTAGEAVDIFVKEEQTKDARATMFLQALTAVQESLEKAEGALKGMKSQFIITCYKPSQHCSCRCTYS